MSAISLNIGDLNYSAQFYSATSNLVEKFVSVNIIITRTQVCRLEYKDESSLINMY